MKHGPGCNCCDCTIVSESFTVADGTAIEDVPGWFLSDTDCVLLGALGTAAEVQSGVLETTSSDLKAVAAIGGVVEDEWIVQSDVKGDDEGDELEVIAIADGAFRCYFLLLRLTVSDTCPTLQIVYLENTVENPNTETILREIPLPDAAVGEWHRLKACVVDAPAAYPYGGYYNKRVFGSVTTNLGTTRYVLADVLWLSDFGITGVGTGAITTKAYFDNFEMSRHQSITSKSCPRCRVAICEYSTDDFTDGIDCVWDQSYTSPEVFDAPVTAHVSYTTMRGTRPASGVPFIRHKIGNPYNHALNSVEVYFLIENEGDTIGIAPIADETGPGPTVFFTAGPEDSDCGYLQMNNTSAVHLPVPAFGANVWVHARVCYGWNYWGTGKILSVVVNESDPTKRVMYSIDVDDYDTDDYNAGIGGGPFWYSALSYAVGTAGNKVYFRDFAVSLSYSADPLLTGTYGYARECQKCYQTIDFCLWVGELCVSAFSDCLVADSGSWNCAEYGIDGYKLRGASGSQRIWQIANPYLSTAHRVEGVVSANGESDQTVIICYDQDSGDYIGLKFTWDNTCGSVQIIENGSAIRTMESVLFEPGRAYQFCLQHAGGFVYAWARSYDLGRGEPESTLTRHTVVLQAETTSTAIGVWCGAKTGTWADPGTVADFYDLIFYTARATEFPQCEPCSECNVAVNVDGGGCEVTGLTSSTSELLVAGETASLAFASLEEPNVTADFSIDCVDYGQTATFSLGPHSITITASSGPDNDDGQITTTSGDLIVGLSIEPTGTLADMTSFSARICVNGTTVRFRVGQFLASYYPSASTPWTNIATMVHGGPDDAGWTPPKIYFKRCEQCGTICDACDNGYLPEAATLDATFSTGNSCCDSFDGIYYIEMDGCIGVSDAIIGSGNCQATWTITLTQFVGFVRVMAELYLQDPYPNPGVYFRWKTDVPSIVDPALNGVVDCRSLGRMTLDYFEQDLEGYTTQCSPAGVSIYTGTQIFLEIA